MKRLSGLLFIGMLAICVEAQPLKISTSFSDGALDIYAAFTGKTVLRPCQLPKLQEPNFPKDFTNRSDMVVFIEKEYTKIGYEFVPAGEKFVMVIQTKTRTNTLFATQLSRFQPPALNTNPPAVSPAVAGMVAAGTINFQIVPISDVLEIYSALLRCKIVQPTALPVVCITLRTQQSLTREEVIYALNITMVLNGIVPIDDGGGNISIVPLDRVSLEKFGPK